MQGIGDVEQNAVSRTRTCCQTDLGENRDVVALVGDVRFLRSRPVIAARPKSGDDAACGIGKNARPVDDLRLLRGRERHLNDINAEERRAGIFLRIFSRAARKLLAGPDLRCALNVNVQVCPIYHTSWITTHPPP